MIELVKKCQHIYGFEYCYEDGMQQQDSPFIYPNEKDLIFTYCPLCGEKLD